MTTMVDMPLKPNQTKLNIDLLNAACFYKDLFDFNKNWLIVFSFHSVQQLTYL